MLYVLFTICILLPSIRALLTLASALAAEVGPVGTTAAGEMRDRLRDILREVMRDMLPVMLRDIVREASNRLDLGSVEDEQRAR
jgi:hypothetical protein